MPVHPPTAGPVLAIEASQRDASVALRLPLASPERDVIHLESVGQAGVGEDLVPAIDRLCRRHGVAPQELRVVAVSTGPGGFTGLRVSLAVVKTLGLTTAAALVGVRSALVAARSAEDLPLEFRSLCTLLALKRCGDAVTAWVERFRREPGDTRWRPEGPARVRTIAAPPSANPPDLLQPADADCFVFDPEPSPEWTDRCAAAGRPCRPLRLTARDCLLVGEMLLAEGHTVTPSELLPLYAREPEAVTLWKARYGA